LDLLKLPYRVVVEPLLPPLAGAGLFMLTRSHLIAAGLSALGFGAWGALYFSRLSLNGPLSGALYGLGVDGVTSGLVALAGSGYVRLIGAEARRLGTERTAIVHAVGIAFAATAFVLLLVTNGSDKAGIGLYLFMLAWSLGAGAAPGSFGGSSPRWRWRWSPWCMASGAPQSPAVSAMPAKPISRSSTCRRCWCLFSRPPPLAGGSAAPS